MFSSDHPTAKLSRNFFIRFQALLLEIQIPFSAMVGFYEKLVSDASCIQVINPVRPLPTTTTAATTTTSTTRATTTRAPSTPARPAQTTRRTTTTTRTTTTRRTTTTTRRPTTTTQPPTNPPRGTIEGDCEGE